MNADRLIADAKKEVLALAASGYVQPQQRTDILALGNPALATLKLGIHQMKRAGYISDHDALIGEKLARILTGGDLNHPTRVSEQYLFDLEREAFLSLVGTRKTQERLAAHVENRKAVEKLTAAALARSDVGKARLSGPRLSIACEATPRTS